MRPDTRNTLRNYMMTGTALFQLQYSDFNIDEWTVPQSLTTKHAVEIYNDDSIKAIKLISGNKAKYMVP